MEEKEDQTTRVEASGVDGGSAPPGPVTLDPFVQRMILLGIPVTRSNYLRIVEPEADPSDLDAELEASLPPELRLQDEGDD